jgi:hypothetical protein
MIWYLSNRADPRARDIADRHYNRQKPGAPQFVPPGRCLVLFVPGAFWITSWPFGQFVKHAWPGAWVCSAFRREYGDMIASRMVEDALAATRWRWPEVPNIMCSCGCWVAMVTFVDGSKVRHKRDLGRCFRRAGFVACDKTTKAGLTVLHIDARAIPLPAASIGAQAILPYEYP